MYLDISYCKLQRALRFRDRLSISYDCELRPPFLYYELVSYVFQMPDNYFIDSKLNKKILHEIMSKKIPYYSAFGAKRQVQTP